jgi:hypothetical protein
MTNYEKLTSLPEEEMAWFLMAYAETCRFCIYKQECHDRPKDITCIDGVKEWMKRESTEDDDEIFAICRNNVLVDRWNSMTPEERKGWNCHSQDGRLTEIVPIAKVENPFE